MRGLPFVSMYIDDVLIHLESEELHKAHLQEAFKRLRRLTLRGVKCQIGMSQVTYPGHVFLGKGMSPDGSKIRAVTEWPKPVDAGDVRQFLGLASYYRRYINHFADLAAPLHQLTHNNVEFQWTEECNKTFESLKSQLTQAPILVFPRFDRHASRYNDLADRCKWCGTSAVLEQEGHVIGYASRTLLRSESNYSVIQKECLAIVWGMMQFRHDLLGRPFQLMTDHAPLQWLAEQKSEGLLC